MKSPKAPALFDCAGLLALAGTLVALAVHWYGLGPVPPAGDYADHLLKSASFHYGVTAGSAAERITGVLGWRDYYPPLTYGLTSLFYGLGGVSVPAALASQGVTVFLYLFCLFGFARAAWDRTTAWVVTLLGGTAPLLVFNTHYYFLELPETCWLAATLMCLHRSDDFKNRKFSILCGFAVAAGCLTKWTFLWFALPPLLWCGLRALPRTTAELKGTLWHLLYPATLAVSFLLMKSRYFHGFQGPVTPLPWLPLHLFLLFFALAAAMALVVRLRRPARPADNFLLSLLPSLALAWPWYLQNLDLMLEKMGTHSRTYPVAQNLAQSTMQHLTTIREDLVFCLPLLLVAGLVFFAVRADYRRVLVPALLGLASGAAVTVLFMPMGNRYSLPALPFLALLCLGWIHYVRPERRRIVAACAALLSLWQLFGWVVFWSGGLAERIGDYKLSPRLPPLVGALPAAVEHHLFSVCAVLPSGKDFALSRVIAEAQRLAGGGPAKLAVVSPDIGIIKEETFAWYAMARRAPLFFFRVTGEDQRSYGDILSVRRYEAVLRRTGELSLAHFDELRERGLVLLYRTQAQREELSALAARSLPPAVEKAFEQALPEGLRLELFRLGP